MKNIFIVIIVGLVLNTFSINSQTKSEKYFVGNIKYINEFVIKTDNVTAEYLEKIFGKSADLYFKDGSYKESYDGGTMLEQLYRQKDNKVYIKNNSSDTLLWYTCNQPAQKILKYEILHKTDTILGVICDEYKTYYEKKTVTFFFNSDTLKINPSWYSEFKMTNKNINTARMKSMYLRYKIEYADFVATVTATEIHQQPIDDSTFEFKSNAILVKDPTFN